MTTLIQHKKARFNFEILESYEAGIELFGHEVKSLRNKQGTLEGAHVIVRGNEAFLVGATIPPYQASNTPKSYDSERPRKLLLSRKEIADIAGAESKKGLTIIPILVYSKRRKLKLQIAVARGKKKHDKRETMKERESKRAIERTLKDKY
ncbi:SsrA-binding protein SmpB [Candidatus Kaiserbacteria bacterium]|nr:SsrA-binding protein SmpB [Candidatus Kaiserbacteria bacterium]